MGGSGASVRRGAGLRRSPAPGTRAPGEEFEHAIERGDQVDNHVVAIGHIALRRRSSGVSIDQQTAWVAEFAPDHRITKMSVYLSADEALKAVGLEA